MMINTYIPSKFNVLFRLNKYGSTIFTIPDNIRYLKITCIGGGGAGNPSGAGGGAGGFFQGIFRVIRGKDYIFTVGRGGQYGVNYGNGSGNATSSFFGINNGEIIGTSLYGNCSSNIYGGNGGDVLCPLATLVFKGGQGGGASNGFFGGGGGIALSNGSDGYISNTYGGRAAGSGGGAFGGHAGRSVVSFTTNYIAYSGGGGGIGYKGGDAALSNNQPGGGGGVYSQGVQLLGGANYDGYMQSVMNTSIGNGGGGVAGNSTFKQGRQGSIYLASDFRPLSLLPPNARLFYKIFNGVGGAAGGCFCNTVTTAIDGMDSYYGGGTGAVGSYAGTANGGSSYICGGGGGSLDSGNGGNGAGGGGGGGGATPGKGGDGYMLIEG